MHSARWADRITALETRMQELLTSHRILRNDIDLADRNESDTCFLSNPIARGIYGSVSATMNQLIGLLERHDAIDHTTLKPDLVRVYASLPSDEESLARLERITDILREAIEIIGLVLEERRRAFDVPTRPIPHESLIRLKYTATQPPEPRIRWSSSPTSYSFVAPMPDTEEDGLVLALSSLPIERLERVLGRVRRDRSRKRTG